MGVYMKLLKGLCAWVCSISICFSAIAQDMYLGNHPGSGWSSGGSGSGSQGYQHPYQYITPPKIHISSPDEVRERLMRNRSSYSSTPYYPPAKNELTAEQKQQIDALKQAALNNSVTRADIDKLLQKFSIKADSSTAFGKRIRKAFSDLAFAYKQYSNHASLNEYVETLIEADNAYANGEKYNAKRLLNLAEDSFTLLTGRAGVSRLYATHPSNEAVAIYGINNVAVRDIQSLKLIETANEFSTNAVIQNDPLLNLYSYLSLNKMSSESTHFKTHLINSWNVLKFANGLVTELTQTLVEDFEQSVWMVFHFKETQEAIAHVLFNKSFYQYLLNESSNIWGTIVSGDDHEQGKIIGKYLSILMPGAAGLKAAKIASTLPKLSKMADDHLYHMQGLKDVVSYNPLQEVGPLHYIPADPTKGDKSPSIASTFRSNTYVGFVTTQDTYVYRVFSNPERTIGGHMSRSLEDGPTQAMLDRGLNPTWGNQATHWAKIKIPPGYNLYEGPVGPIGNWPGTGKNQLYSIEARKGELPPGWEIVEKGEFHER
jgi:hypothetical protein